MALTLRTTAFENGAKIPGKHTCKGADVPPPLSWDGVPGGTASLALTLEDPDAPGGTFLHWIIYDIPAHSRGLELIVPVEKHLKNGAIQGKNDFGKTGYGGPCPPKGEEHRYFFRLYALKKKLRPESIHRLEDFYKVINGLVLDKAEYMGRFQI